MWAVLQVISLPYYEWAELDTEDQQRSYIKSKVSGHIFFTPEDSKANSLLELAELPIPGGIKTELAIAVKPEEEAGKPTVITVKEELL